MSVQLFEKGREGFADGTLDWDTNTFKVALLDLNTADVGVKAITGASNPGNPIVITCTAHGFANGDRVVIGGVGGNLAANGTFKIQNQATNTFEIVTDTPEALNTTGSGAYTSGGYAVCLGPSAAGDNLDDFDGCRVGSDQTIVSPTAASGVLDAADLTFTAVSGATVEAWLLYKDTGAAASSRCVLLNDGKIKVVVGADASSSATSVVVEPLEAAIPNGTAIVFSNGVTGTLTSQANQFARVLAVSALPGAIARGHTGDATHLSAGLPLTPNGGNINLVFDNGANKIARI